eukprot:1096333-Pelagomonas_calceolata.AAC.3
MHNPFAGAAGGARGRRVFLLSRCSLLQLSKQQVAVKFPVAALFLTVLSSYTFALMLCSKQFALLGGSSKL